MLGGKTKEEEASAMFLKSGDIVVICNLFPNKILIISLFNVIFEYFSKFICFFYLQQCMSKESRLCYHAVPRIIKTNTDWVNLPLNETDEMHHKEQEITTIENVEEDIDSDEGNKNRKKRRLTSPSDNEYNDEFVECLWNSIADSKQWKPFGDYITDCRINVNVRQVLEHGEQSLNLQ